jgi:hypothetical protein
MLRSGDETLRAARGSFCWISPPRSDATRRAVCVDTAAPVTDDSLPVRSGGGLRVDMRTAVDSLHASLRGREGRLRVRSVGASERRFVIRLPRRLRDRAVLDLFARYPQGDGFFGARLRIP